ncbi:Uncharacterized protein Rs2_05689 [Raphanus sativus]|nr:Uncharacterized protein Rs2_05689 [Raphanus sativus]
MDRYTSNGLEALMIMTSTEDQEQPPVSTTTPAHMNVVAPARPGLKFSPEELDDHSTLTNMKSATLRAYTVKILSDVSERGYFQAKVGQKSSIVIYGDFFNSNK